MYSSDFVSTPPELNEINISNHFLAMGAPPEFIDSFQAIKMSEYHDVWEYFKRSDEKAECNICQKTLGCKGSSTTGLHRHLAGVHAMKRKLKEESVPCTSKKVKTIDNYIIISKNSTTLEKLVSELAAKDGIPISTICKSEFIRNSLTSQGFILPKQPSDVMKLVYKYYDIVKQEIMMKISKMKAENKKFSQSIYEWTSFRNHRYMNVNLYYYDGESENLGLIRIQGSCSAEEAIELIDSQLKSFGLSFERDIVSTTTDGASIMVKFGKLSLVHQQLCYNHAIHLAVMDVFYEKNQESSKHSNEDSSESEHESEDEFVLEKESKFIAENTRMNISIYKTIQKIRKIVKLFRNSPVRNAVLQNHVKVIEKKELQLLLDCKTRWNTIEIMIERFLRIKSPIVRSLQDLNLSDLWIAEVDEVMASNILKILKPVRIAIEALSRKDANLLTGEGVLKFLFKALRENNSEISTRLLHEIKNQIVKRRDVSLISLIKFLQDPSCLQFTEKDDFFVISTKNEIVKRAKTIMKRLFNYSNEKNNAATMSHDQEPNEEILKGDQDGSLSLDKQLEESIRQSLKPNQLIDDDFRSLSKEITIYEATGNITNNLEQLKNALSTIKPTCTQNEKYFSISGHFVCKRRARLSDKSIDCLCFLKNYFLKSSQN